LWVVAFSYDIRVSAQRLHLAVFFPRALAFPTAKPKCESRLPELANFAKVIGDAFNR
jgi:hypothetical protein